MIGVRHHVGRRLGRDDEVVGAQIEGVTTRVRFEHGIEAGFVGVDRHLVGVVPGVAQRADEPAIQRFGAAAFARSPSAASQPRLSSRPPATASS